MEGSLVGSKVQSKVFTSTYQRRLSPSLVSESSVPEGDAQLEEKVKHLMFLDCYWSRKWSIYSGFYSTKSFQRIRVLLKLLEFSGHGVPWLALVAWMAYIFKASEQEFWMNMFLALIFDLIVTALIKIAVKRPRPHYNENDMKLTLKIDEYAFPSGHTTRGFMIFVLLCFYDFSVTVKFLIMLWACILGASRIMLGRHHITDVLFGVLIGIGEAVLVLNLLWYTPARGSDESAKDL